MYLDRDQLDPEPRRIPELSRRVTILGAIAVAIFAAVFLRLWYLQVLSGDDYREQANENRVREIRVQAPRGDIVDRNGKVLVDNRTRLSLQVAPDDLPKPGPDRKAELGRLEPVIGMTPAEIEQKIAEEQKVAPGFPVTLVADLGSQRVYYLRENQSRFPGFTVERQFVRDYRQGSLAAHLFGNVGEVTAEQLGLPRYEGLAPGDLVGQTGIEYEYDRYLRGKPGATRFQVDSFGRPRGRLQGKRAHAGDSLRLTIDSNLQATGDAALGSFGLPGAYVAMDVRNGEILAIGSTPTFDPAIFTKPITQSQYKALISRANDAPLANRAIQGLYPTGSIFKPITAVASLEEGLITPQEIVNDTGVVKVGGEKFRNAGDKVYGPLNMTDALKVSSDVYFYKLGLEAPAEKGGGAIQDWAHDFGLGERTGIDIPQEVEGLVPTPSWRNKLYQDKLTDRPWSVGDNINLAVGQGDLQADPLQMAVAYAALGNGGRVLRPHLGQTVESVTGEALAEIAPAPRRQLDLSKNTRDVVMEGLRRAAMEPGGTSYPVFGNFKVDIAGKTGTAQRGFYNSGLPVPDQSWYAALAPARNPKIVVVATVERGGFGADTAAPLVARILERYFRLSFTPATPAADQASTLDY